MRFMALVGAWGVTAALLAACGNDEGGDAAGSPAASGPAGPTTSGGGDGGAGGTAGPGPGSGGSPQGSGGAGVGGSAEGGAAGAGGDGAAGGGSTTLNGCTKASAENETGKGTVAIGDGNTPPKGWTFGHQRCVRVSKGTKLTWKGDFGFHPLKGGEQGIPAKIDPESPISKATPMGGVVTVVIDAAGDYGYLCTNHTTMKGVVYVE
jgi:plastocyanin